MWQLSSGLACVYNCCSFQTSRQLLSGRDAPPAVRGLLADALCCLAEGLAHSSNKQRQQLRLKLLLLFSDVGSRMGAPGPGLGSIGGGSQDQVLTPADLGELLPAVAAGAEGLQPGTLRLLGGSSTNRMSMQEIRVGCPCAVSRGHTPQLSLESNAACTGV
jgi:hypothetical protein